MYKRIVTSALLFGAAALAPPAYAANCAPRDSVVERLQSKFSEQLTAGGLQATQPVQTMVEVWSSPDTGTFTVLLTNPNGISCIVGAGTDFFSYPIESTPDSTAS